jgi:hypothetical protein
VTGGTFPLWLIPAMVIVGGIIWIFGLLTTTPEDKKKDEE